MKITGAWAGNVSELAGLPIPVIPMKHSYIVSEPIEGVSVLPNIRDHDSSIYFRVQGDSLCLGGYESNPAILDQVGIALDEFQSRPTQVVCDSLAWKWPGF